MTRRRQLRAAALAVAVVAGGIAMSFVDGLTRNWADFRVNDADPRLRPVTLVYSPAEAVRRATAAIPTHNRWAIVAGDPDAGTLHATHTTRLWRFVDDVQIRFVPTDNGCRAEAHSQSRIGKGDFGQNARNLRELHGILAGL